MKNTYESWNFFHQSSIGKWMLNAWKTNVACKVLILLRLECFGRRESSLEERVREKLKFWGWFSVGGVIKWGFGAFQRPKYPCLGVRHRDTGCSTQGIWASCARASLQGAKAQLDIELYCFRAHRCGTHIVWGIGAWATSNASLFCTGAQPYGAPVRSSFGGGGEDMGDRPRWCTMDPRQGASNHQMGVL